MRRAWRRETTLIVLLTLVGSALVSRPAFYPQQWLADSGWALVPLALAGFLAGSGLRRAGVAAAAIVVAAAAFSVGWLVLIAPTWPTLIHFPFPGGLLQPGESWPPVLSGQQLLVLGVQLAPGAAIRAAALFMAGLGLRAVFTGSRAAVAS
jgi:hypothetical protein